MDEFQLDDRSSATFSSKDNLTFRTIILEHLRRISKIASVELVEGYDSTISNREGGISRVYVPATSDAYCNAVDWLADALLPYYDDEMVKAEDNITKKFSKAADRREEIILKRELFRALSRFLYRQKYLDVGMIVD